MPLTKKELRQLIYDKRKDLNKDIKSKLDSIILSRLLDSDFYKSADIIFTYVSFEGEVDTHEFIKRALSDGKTICVPRVISKKEGMEAYIIESLSELETGFYGILEPKASSKLVEPLKIDLLIMPGVAFDKGNGRIGYGGGFYDRFLRRVSKYSHKVALAYDFQIFDCIPTDEFDEKVDLIITSE